MAAIPVNIKGTITKKTPKGGLDPSATEEVLINGLLSIAGLIVDGGPIINPDPPVDPPPGGTPDNGGFLKPPPPEGGWGYHQDYGWVYAPGTGGAGPKAR